VFAGHSIHGRATPRRFRSDVLAASGRQDDSSTVGNHDAGFDLIASSCGLVRARPRRWHELLQPPHSRHDLEARPSRRSKGCCAAVGGRRIVVILNGGPSVTRIRDRVARSGRWDAPAAPANSASSLGRRSRGQPSRQSILTGW
jgi:hypothetical protein